MNSHLVNAHAVTTIGGCRSCEEEEEEEEEERRWRLCEEEEEERRWTEHHSGMKT